MKKQPITPVSMIKNCFRTLTMRCGEGHAVRKRDGNSCRICGRKHSVAKGMEVKIQVHHTVKPNWDRIIQAVREELLNQEVMICLCEQCHAEVHEKDKSGWRGGSRQETEPKKESNDGREDDPGRDRKETP